MQNLSALNRNIYSKLVVRAVPHKLLLPFQQSRHTSHGTFVDNIRPTRLSVASIDTEWTNI